MSDTFTAPLDMDLPDGPVGQGGLPGKSVTVPFDECACGPLSVSLIIEGKAGVGDSDTSAGEAYSRALADLAAATLAPSAGILVAYYATSSSSSSTSGDITTSSYTQNGQYA